MPLGMFSLVGSNLCVPFEELANIPCAWCLSLLDLVGLPICISSLVGSNLYDKFWCKEDFEGLIVFFVITSICGDAN